MELRGVAGGPGPAGFEKALRRDAARFLKVPDLFSCCVPCRHVVKMSPWPRPPWPRRRRMQSPGGPDVSIRRRG